MKFKKLIIKDTIIDLNSIICIHKELKRWKSILHVYLTHNIRVSIIYNNKDVNDLLNLAELISDLINDDEYTFELAEDRINVYSKSIAKLDVYGIYYLKSYID